MLRRSMHMAVADMLSRTRISRILQWISPANPRLCGEFAQGANEYLTLDLFRHPTHICAARQDALRFVPQPFLGVSSLNLGRLANASRPLSFLEPGTARWRRCGGSAVERSLHHHDIDPTSELVADTANDTGMYEARTFVDSDRAAVL